MVREGWDSPNAQPPDVTSRLLLEELANLLDLGASRRGIEEEVTELARVGFDVDGALGGSRITLKDQDLVFGAAFLLDGVHCNRHRELTMHAAARVGRVAGSGRTGMERERVYGPGTWPLVLWYYGILSMSLLVVAW